MANSNFDTTTRWVAQVYVVDTGVTNSYSSSYTTYPTTVHKNGVTNPGYKKAIRRLQEAGTNYSVEVYQEGTIQGSAKLNYKYPGSNGYRYRQEIRGDLARGGNVPPSPPILPDLSALDIQARLGFISKAQRARGGFETGVFLGELRETIRTIVRPASSVRGALDDYYRDVKKRTRGKRGVRALNRAVAGSWLETSFAIKPLLAEVDNAMETIAGQNLVYDQPISFTAKDAYNGSRTVRVCGYSGVGGGVFAYAHRDVAKMLVKYKGLVAWESENLAPTWRSTWGLTLRDFVPTVYELIPYSWLVDYFSNLGAIINGMCAGAIQLRWGTRVLVFDGQVEFETPVAMYPDNTYPEWEGSVDAHIPVIRRFSYNRSVIDKVSVNLLDLRTNLPGRWTQWANIGALASMRTL